MSSWAERWLECGIPASAEQLGARRRREASFTRGTLRVSPVAAVALLFLFAAGLCQPAVAAPGITLQQARNGPETAPISPVEYVNGNVGSGNSHFVEGQSASYRAVMNDLPEGGTVTLTIGYDIKHSGRHAIDYLTSFDRLIPHYFSAHTEPEQVNPLLGLSGVPEAYTEFELPAPSSHDSPVAGMPGASFSRLLPAQRVMRLYGGTIAAIGLTEPGDLNAEQSSAELTVTFKASAPKAVLAWGGHIASSIDWPPDARGVNRSAAGISGSPYHMRIVSWSLGNPGQQDRSLSADQVTPPPPCTVSGPLEICAGEIAEYAVGSALSNPSYAWSILENSTGASFASPPGSASVQINSGMTGGSYTVHVRVTDQYGYSTECVLGPVVVNPLPVCAIDAPLSITAGRAATFNAPPDAGSFYAWSASFNNLPLASGTGTVYTLNVPPAYPGTLSVKLVTTNVNSCYQECVREFAVVAPSDCIVPTDRAQCPGAFQAYELNITITEPETTSVTWEILAEGNTALASVTNETQTSCSVTATRCGEYVLRMTAVSLAGELSCAIPGWFTDTNAPQFASFPADLTVSCEESVPGADTDLVTAVDACGGEVLITHIGDAREDGDCPGRYTIRRTYAATDICGNSAQRTQRLTVEDNQVPSFTVCPPSATVYMDAEGRFSADPSVTGIAAALDNCDTNPVITFADEVAPGPQPSGKTVTRTWMARDQCGNVATCVQLIYAKNGAPVIVVQPENQTVKEGEPATLCVEAEGLSPLTYQWRHNGVNIEGATNSCVTIPATTLLDGGTYTVLVANEIGIAVSAPALLDFLLTYFAGGDHFSQKVAIYGTNGTFRSHNFSATFEPAEPHHAGKIGGKSVWFTWRAPVTGVATLKTTGSSFDTLLGIYTGSTLMGLEVRGSDEDLGGFYTSKARFNMIKNREYQIAVDGFGGLEGTFVVDYDLLDKPHLMPIFLAQPQNQTVLPGENAIFSAVAARVCGNGVENCPHPSHYPQNELPTLNYQWYFGGVPIAGATSTSVTISNAQAEAVGNYHLVVFSKWETNESAEAVLQLLSTDGGLQNVQAFDKFEDAEHGPPLLVGVLEKTNRPVIATAQALAAQASVVSGYSGSLVFNTTGSATSPLEVICGVIGGASKWVTFVPEAAGTLSLDTRRSTYNTVMACYRRNASNPAILDEVACNNNASPTVQYAAISFPVQAGQTNFVLIDGVNGASGTLYLNYTNTVIVSAPENVPFRLQGRMDQASGAVDIEITGQANKAFTIELSHDLVNWSTLLTTNSPTGVYNLRETNPASSAQPRYYRTYAP